VGTIIGGASSGPTWGALVVPLVFIPSLITLVACAMYARRVRSRSAAAMFWGSLGGLIASVAGLGVTTYLGATRAATNPQELAATLNRFSAVRSAVAFAFSLLFSVGLLLVLRDAARRSGGGTGPESVEPGEPASDAGPPN
jgi:hypothetical protein